MIERPTRCEVGRLGRGFGRSLVRSALRSVTGPAMALPSLLGLATTLVLRASPRKFFSHRLCRQEATPTISTFATHVEKQTPALCAGWRDKVLRACLLDFSPPDRNSEPTADAHTVLPGAFLEPFSRSGCHARPHLANVRPSLAQVGPTWESWPESALTRPKLALARFYRTWRPARGNHPKTSSWE